MKATTPAADCRSQPCQGSRLARKRNAFSLLELLAVVTILGLIAAVAIARFSTATDRAKDRLNVHNKAVINAMIERYYMETADWPTALGDLDSDDYFPDGVPQHPDGGSYEYDTDTKRVSDPTPEP